MSKFGLVADLHVHNFSMFNSTFEDGTTQRALSTCDALKEAAHATHEFGGSALIMAGDIFHVRGKLSPTVVNPLVDTIEFIKSELSLEIIMIPGNHDLETEQTTLNGSAVHFLRDAGVWVFGEPHYDEDRQIYYLPWEADLEKLKGQLEHSDWFEPEHRPLVSVVMHAPINGVIKGLPPNGLDPAYLAGLGYQHIFAGHYHDHKHFGMGVYSIGALTHQSFSDMNSKAGFMLVDTAKDGQIRQFDTGAPKFMELDLAEPDDRDYQGHYVRVTTSDLSASERSELRLKVIAEHYAADVMVRNLKVSAEYREEKTSDDSGSLELEQITHDYLHDKYKGHANVDQMVTLANSVYQEALEQLD